MKNGYWFLIIAVSFVIGVLFGARDIRPNGPIQVIRGTDSVAWMIDTIHDTATVWRGFKYIKDTVYVMTIALHDTVRIDSSRCWEFGEKERDGAEIDIRLCSDSLPAKPLDLRYMVGYIRPPIDSVKTITRIDTRIVVKENRRKQFFVGLVSGLAGVGVGCLTTEFLRR